MTRGLTDSDYIAQRDRVEPLFVQWREWLGLNWWKVDISYDAVNEATISNDDDSGTAMSTVSLMECVADWEYMELTVRVNLLEVRNLDDGDLENCVVHELCHALVCEMRDWDQSEAGRKHEERVVVHLARAFVWVAENAAEWQSVAKETVSA